MEPNTDSTTESQLEASLLDPSLIPDRWDIFTDQENVGNPNAIELRYYQQDDAGFAASICVITPEMGRGHDDKPVVEVQDENAGEAAMGYVNPQAVYEAHDTMEDAIDRVYELAYEYPLPSTLSEEDRDIDGWDDHPLDPTEIPDRWAITRNPQGDDHRAVELRHGERPPTAVISMTTPETEVSTNGEFAIRVGDANADGTADPGFFNPRADGYEADTLTDAIDRLCEFAVVYPHPETREETTTNIFDSDDSAGEDPDTTDTDETPTDEPTGADPNGTVDVATGDTERTGTDAPDQIPVGYAAAYHNEPKQRAVIETDYPDEIQHAVAGLRAYINIVESVHEGQELPEQTANEVGDMERIAAKLSQAADKAEPLTSTEGGEVNAGVLNTAYAVLESLRESLHDAGMDAEAEVVNEAHYQLQLFEESN